MANKLVMQRLNRITLVEKTSHKTPAHPELRSGVIEVVKATDDWYQDFADFISQCPEDDIPEDWCEAFEASRVEKAKGKNYPDSQGPFAGPHNSFPIRNQSDVYDAARLVGHAANPAAVKARIIAIARSKGYSLPKSWTSGKSTVKKADFFAAARSFFFGEDSGVVVEDDETPQGDPVDVQKAANPMHAHTHAHLSSYGYSYSHNHDHGHRDGVTPNSDNHDTHETAHAHQHVSKAGDSVTPEQLDSLLADLKGLSEDLGRLKAARESSDQELASLKEQVTEVTKARDEAIAKLQTAESEKTQAVEKATQLETQLKDAGRQPMVGGPVTEVEKAQPKITRDMKFNDAFALAMGRTSPIPPQ